MRLDHLGTPERKEVLKKKKKKRKKVRACLKDTGILKTGTM